MENIYKLLCENYEDANDTLFELIEQYYIDNVISLSVLNTIRQVILSAMAKNIKVIQDYLNK